MDLQWQNIGFVRTKILSKQEDVEDLPHVVRLGETRCMVLSIPDQHFAHRSVTDLSAQHNAAIVSFGEGAQAKYRT